MDYKKGALSLGVIFLKIPYSQLHRKDPHVLSVTVQKDISSYKEKIALGLSGRSLIAGILGIAVAIALGLFGMYVLNIDLDYLAYVIIVVIVPFWLIGFYRPQGMNFEDYFPYLYEYFLGNNFLPLISSAVLKAKQDQRKEKPLMLSKEHKALKAQPCSELLVPRVFEGCLNQEADITYLVEVVPPKPIKKFNFKRTKRDNHDTEGMLNDSAV